MIEPPHNLIQAFSSSSDAFCILNQEGTILVANTALNALLFEDTSTQKLSFYDLLPPDTQDSLKKYQGILTSETTEHSFEAKLSAPNHQERWFSWKINRLSDGLWFAVGREITALCQKNKELDIKESRLREFIDHAVDAFIIHDMEGRFVDFNQAACELLGYTPEEMLQISVSDMDITIDKRNLGGIWRRLTPGSAITVESTQIRKDGTTFPVEVRGGLFGPPDNLLMLAMCRDISERKREEEARKQLTQHLREAHAEARQANHFKSAFLANMSHEIRTPLTAIIGYTELLQEELEDDQKPELVNDTLKIRQASYRLLNLINDILDLSKIEAGKMDLEKEQFQLSELLSEVEGVMSPLLEKQNNQLTFSVPKDDILLNTDRARLNQILLNLLSNANKFTQQGQLSLNVTLNESTTEIPWLTLSVKDTGVGIPHDRISSLFEPFSQANQSTWKNYGGTGLGLSITKQLCRLLGGEISAESTPQKGSTFTIHIPTTPPPPQPKTQHETLQHPNHPTQPLVLLIDHDPHHHDTLSKLLTQHELQMRSAFNSIDGLSLARALLPDTIILRYDLPKLNGLNLTHKLNEDPLLQNIPTLIYTTNPPHPTSPNTHNTKFIQLPIDEVQLIAALNESLSPN